MFILIFANCGPEPTRDYIFILNYEQLINMDPDIHKILELNYTCPSYYLPSSSSKLIIIKNDSLQIVPIYQLNWFERMAGSRPTKEKYFREINRRLTNSYTNTYKLDTIRSILSAERYICYANSMLQNYFNKDKVIVLSELTSVNTFREICAIKDDLPLAIDLINNIPVEEFNVGKAKVETYNTMRRFYENMEILYENINNSEAKTDAIELIKKLFASPDSYIEIRNNNGPVERYTVQEFLSRITSNNRYQYDDVSMFMRNFRFLKEFEETNSGDIPDNYPAEITYDQIFKGVSNGKIKYQDVVNKEVGVEAKLVERINTMGDIVMKYEIFIKDIRVN